TEADNVDLYIIIMLNCPLQEGRLCDLSIQVQGQVFRAHRCVLAASSPYFHDQVLLKNVTTVSLPSVMDPVAFESVLSSAYTGQLSLVHDDIVNYVTVASFLQMWHIVDKCTEILKSGDFTSCEEVWEPAPTKSYQFAQDPNRHRAGVSGSESGKHRARFPQRGGLTGADRESGDGDETQERRKDERRETERPLVPPSPDFTIAASEVNWTSSCPGQSSSLSFSSHRQASSPPTPSSSSTVSLAGAPYTGKVHFCHCGKAYTLKSMRDRHVKMQHLNLRPFGCPVCTKSFKMKHHLTKHLKTHGGLRPYECGLCGKKVIWRDSFLRHQARCERLASTSIIHL
uniref:Zinc finger and BTB domain containing 22a n=1 Tax=Takifugu rubripes TaxID=31033 RepID=H2UAG9_TAKRU